jgi:hypothetical protein
VGTDPAAAPGVGQFFASPGLDGGLVTLGEPAGQGASGLALSLLVRFPSDQTGSDPIVVSGVTGAGDFLYVSYLAGNRLRFGFDHWGAGGAVGEPVTFNPMHLHRLQIESASLHSTTGQLPAGAVRVKLDGVVVLDGRSLIHPHSQEQVYIGANPIGGSTCGTVFHGEVLDIRADSGQGTN